MSSPEKPYKGNPSFPNVNPQYIPPGGSSNDTQVMYILDNDNKAVILGNVQDESGATDTHMSGRTINSPKYGRYKKIVVSASSSNGLYVYPYVDASGTN